MPNDQRPSKMQKRVTALKRKAHLGVKHRSEFDNIYHCCVQRTASQWLRNIYNDEVFYRNTGLRAIPYKEMGLASAHIDEPFPKRTIVTHLYISYPTYLSIPKPRAHRYFFVQRDPRDAVVSWYYAARYSHKPMGSIPEMRRDLSSMSQEDGIHYMIDAINARATSMRSARGRKSNRRTRSASSAMRTSPSTFVASSAICSISSRFRRDLPSWIRWRSARASSKRAAGANKAKRTYTPI